MAKKVGTRKTTKAKDAGLIPQKHGGALLAGGQKGNKGGGRLPSEIKGTLREIVDDCGIPWIKDVLNAPRTVICKCGEEIEPPANDAVKARVTETVMRVCVGTHVDVEHQGVTVIIDADSLSC